VVSLRALVLGMPFANWCSGIEFRRDLCAIGSGMFVKRAGYRRLWFPELDRSRLSVASSRNSSEGDYCFAENPSMQIAAALVFCELDLWGLPHAPGP